MRSYIRELIALFADYHIDAFLVTKEINVQHLLGWPIHESWLLILPKQIILITDKRYSKEAQKYLKDIVVVECQKSILQEIAQIIVHKKARRIGFDSRHVSHSSFKRLKNSSFGIKLIACDRIVERLRSIKGRKEIFQIKKCIQLNLRAYQFVKRVLKPGISEAQLASRVEVFVKSAGAQMAFPPIIASGSNTSFPHAQITDRKIKKNDIILVDMGVCMKGYNSDLTRMFFLGKIPPLIEKVLKEVKAAQKVAIKKMRSGIKASLVDSEARELLAARGYSKYFIHSLGHGIGREVHEDPILSQRSSAVLQAGMVVTVEPGVYIPNKFGIRLEEMVLVTENGHKILSK